MPMEEPKDYREKNLYQLIWEYELKGIQEVPEEIAILIEMGLSAENEIY